MKSMDNQVFDKKVKRKIDSFEKDVPAGIWDKIELELDASEGPISTPQQENPAALLQRTPPFRTKRPFLVKVGAFVSGIAAMLLITFVFWKSANAPQIYLRANQEVVSVAPQKGEEKSLEQEVTLFPSDPIEEAAPTTLSKPGKVSERRERIAKVSYATVKKVEAPVEAETENKMNFVEHALEVDIVKGLALDEVPHSNGLDGNDPAEETNVQVLRLQEDHNPMMEERGESKNRKLGMSLVFNLLAKGFSGENGSFIEFSENEEGILQWDIKSGLAKNRE